MSDEQPDLYLPAGSDRNLDGLRSQPSGMCWWCQVNPATTREHKHKVTDLRRLAKDDGAIDASNLYRGGPGYNGYLKSLSKGSAVQWGKVMCKECNGGRDRLFDEAYELFAHHVQSHQADLRPARSLNWRSVYGPSWRAAAANLARYYAKQLGCCLATQCMPVPDSIRVFMDGDDSATDLGFELHLSRVHAAFYDRGARDGSDTCGLWLKSAMVHMTPDGQNLVGAEYRYGIGFLTATARWRQGHGRMPTFFARRLARLPMVDEHDSPPLVPDRP